MLQKGGAVGLLLRVTSIIHSNFSVLCGNVCYDFLFVLNGEKTYLNHVICSYLRMQCIGVQQDFHIR
jgi:hypothetical protein